MRRAALLCLLSLVLAGCARGPGQGTGGIVSLNPCADAMLIALVPHDRIRAISHYSHNPSTSSLPLTVARQFPGIAGTAEEVLALRPSLVISSIYTPLATRRAFERAGLNVLYFDSPTTIAASRAQVGVLAAAVDAKGKGDAIMARIDAALAASRAPSATPPVPALLWIGGNLATGSGTLLDEMMRHAGFRNAAADHGLRFTGHLSTEQVVAHPPRVMLVPDLDGRDGDARAASLRARALAASGADVVQAEYPRRLVNCGGPVIADALETLAAVRRQVAG